jgi:hypothetical protein
MNDDLSSRVLLAERYLARCAYLLADVDQSGLRTRKAARLALGKVVLPSAFPFYLQSCNYVHKAFFADAQTIPKEPYLPVNQRRRRRRRPIRVKKNICVKDVKSEVTVTSAPILAHLSIVHTDADGALIPVDVTVQDLSCLIGTEWLNDAVKYIINV